MGFLTSGDIPNLQNALVRMPLHQNRYHHLWATLSVYSELKSAVYGRTRFSLQLTKKNGFLSTKGTVL